MAMARNCYVFAFITIWCLLCVSALDEKEEVKVVGNEQILRLPSEEDSTSQAITWEQKPIEIHSLRFPRKPMIGEEQEDHPSFQQGRLRPVRVRFGRPGGCHGKFKQFLMPKEDPSRPQLLRRMRMGHHRHAHPYLFPAIDDMRNDEKASFRAFHAHLNPERDGMGFEKQREEKFEGSFGEREEEPEDERGAPWTAWLRSMFN